MAAIQDLQAAVAALQTTRDSVILALNAPKGVAEADVAAQASAVIAVTDSLQKALPQVAPAV